MGLQSRSNKIQSSPFNVRTYLKDFPVPSESVEGSLNNQIKTTIIGNHQRRTQIKANGEQQKAFL